MSDDYGNDLITISDDEGNDYTLEHLYTLEEDGNIYMAFLPAGLDEEDEDYGIIILKVDDESLVSIDDDELLERLYDTFMENLFADEDDESEYDDM